MIECSATPGDNSAAGFVACTYGQLEMQTRQLLFVISTGTLGVIMMTAIA